MNEAEKCGCVHSRELSGLFFTSYLHVLYAKVSELSIKVQLTLKSTHTYLDDK